MPLHYASLLAAIACEIIGTSALAASQQFTRLGPSLLVILGYGGAFLLMSHTLKFMAVGVVYAIWSGLGIVGITLVGMIWLGQKPDLAGIAGIVLIIAGVLVIHLFSQMSTH
jgi:small multidrug resistance pump